MFILIVAGVIETFKNLLYGKISSTIDSIKVIKDNTYGLYIFGCFFIFYGLFINKNPFSWVGHGVEYIFMAFFMNKYKSRWLAILISIYVLIDIFTMRTNIYILLFAIIAFLTSLNSLKATFKYWRFLNSNVQVRNVLILSFIAALYSIIFLVFLTVVLGLVSIFLGIDVQATTDLNSTRLGKACTTITASIGIIGIIGIWISTLNNNLPFTKNRPTINL